MEADDATLTAAAVFVFCWFVVDIGAVSEKSSYIQWFIDFRGFLGF